MTRKRAMKRAFLDANVLFSAHLRDVFGWLAFRRVYEARFSNLAHEEWMRAVLKHRPQTSRQSLERTHDLMNRNIPGVLVEGFEPLIETLQLPDANDRHVLAAALQARCDVLVTFNLADFPASARQAPALDLQTPDEFLSALFAAAPQNVLGSLRFQRLNLTKPALEIESFFSNLKHQNIPNFVSALEPFQNQL